MNTTSSPAPGHGVNIEQPEGVNTAIEGFLARIAGAAA